MKTLTKFLKPLMIVFGSTPAAAILFHAIFTRPLPSPQNTRLTLAGYVVACILLTSLGVYMYNAMVALVSKFIMKDVRLTAKGFKFQLIATTFFWAIILSVIFFGKHMIVSN